MKLQIHGDKIVVTKSIKEYLESKMQKLDKYFESADELNCTIKIRSKNNLQTIEVTIPTKSFVIRAEESNSDLYASIDLVIDKLDRQITKNKAKLKKKYKETNSFNFAYEDIEEIIEEDIDITKSKDLNIKPIDVEEAMLQMQLVNHDFFVFKNIDDECVSVLYKRKDGKLGIINVK